MEGLKLPKGALEKEKIRAILSRLDMLEKRANDAETRLEELMKRLDSLNVVDKRIGALEKALEKKK
jgi:tetrahydromethanopterin S-methyltransferase subunit G